MDLTMCMKSTLVTRVQVSVALWPSKTQTQSLVRRKRMILVWLKRLGGTDCSLHGSPDEQLCQVWHPLKASLASQWRALFRPGAEGVIVLDTIQILAWTAFADLICLLPGDAPVVRMLSE